MRLKNDFKQTHTTSSLYVFSGEKIPTGSEKEQFLKLRVTYHTLGIFM